MCEEIKRKVTEVYQKSMTLLMKSHHNEENVFLIVNTWIVSVVRYSATFLDWTKEDTKELDWYSRKQLERGRALQIKSTVMKIYIKCKYGWRQLISVKECCVAESRSIIRYLANNDEMFWKLWQSLKKFKVKMNATRK